MATLAIRQQIAAASQQIRRLKRADRAAGWVITLGGVGIVASVLGILVFILAEAWPLFRPPTSRFVGVTRLGAMAPPASEASASATAEPPLLAVGVDEYQRYAYGVTTDGRLVFHRLADGSLARESAVSGLDGARLTGAARSAEGELVAAGTEDGRVALLQVRFRPKYEGQKLADLDIDVRDRGLVVLDPTKRPIRKLAYRESEGRKAVAAVRADGAIAVWQTDENGEESRAALRVGVGESVTCLSLARVDSLVAGTDKGNVYHWALPEGRLTDVSPVSGKPITALDWILGSVSFVAGDAEGAVSAWSRTRLREDDPEPSMVRVHVFPSQGTAIAAIGASTRDKSFVTAGADGSLVVRHLTSERTLLALPGAGAATLSVLLTPKNDGILVGLAGGALARYEIASPHPEVTWKALFGKVWYEGYPRPEYVWQSTGATNDFETKFSLVPLVFGTLKGTLYALLFAVPVAVLGALYTSQFVHPRIRSKVKPAVEIMAALPSVVIGFVAGLWLAALVERHVVGVLLMGVLVPAAGTAGVLLWGRLPQRLSRRLKPGMELLLIVPLCALGAWLAATLGPRFDVALFHGDFRLWLKSALDLTYDQRNCLVVGLAMGFAVIPIIFTISEDAFSSVPSNLTAASLALGASRWQTALRVVLPTASPGVFSAVMIGFGRAVGETMIVLMATGNTPVLDWSLFNGMRTLSANIAVEIPEAPYGGTLYRVLFLAAGLLFLMTFLVNTAAEIIRQRLRERYRAL